MNVRRGAAGLAAVVVAGGALAGCTASVKGDTIETKVRSVAKQNNVTVKTVSCPDLKAEKGATVTCTATIQGKKYTLKVEATKVDGKTVNYKVNPPEPAKK